MSQNKQINSESIYNISSSLILSGIAFFSMPIFTRLLGAEQYGKFALFNSWVTILVCFLGIKTQSALATGRLFFKEDYLKFRSSNLLCGTLSSLAIIFVILLFRGKISLWLGYNTNIILFLVFCAFSHYIVDFSHLAFLYEKKAKYNLLMSAVLSVSTVLLSVVLIKMSSFEESYLSRVVGVTIPYLIVSIFLWIYFYTQKPFGLDYQFIKYSIAFGFPLIFHSLAQTFLGQSDRIMMKYFSCSDQSIGIYSFFCTFSGVLVVLLNAFNTSWCPFYYDFLDKNDLHQIYSKTKNYLQMFTIMCCGFILLSREVFFFFASDDFLSGINLIPIQTFGIYCIFMYQFPVNYEFFNKKTLIISLGTVFSAITNIILNFFLIPIFGMYGAAIATSASYLLLFFAHFIIVKKLKTTKRFLLPLPIVLPFVLLLFITSVIFYVFSCLIVIRWLLATGLGIWFLYSLYLRKTIF